MASSHVRALRASGFATAPYAPDAKGVLLPQVLPSTCLAKPRQAEEPCRIGVHHWRERKTGPRFPVAVLYCWTHAAAFTLYPPGHFPYGRRALAPLSPRGEVLRDPARPHRPLWQGTLFAAATDAAQGEPWRRHAPGAGELDRSTRDVPSGYWNTQMRYMEEAASVFGLTPTADARLRERLASHLEVPGLVLLEVQRDFGAARGYQARGRALLSILDQLPANATLANRLLGCAAASGYCGPITRWDKGRDGPCSLLFPGRGTPAG